MLYPTINMRSDPDIERLDMRLFMEWQKLNLISRKQSFGTKNKEMQQLASVVSENLLSYGKWGENTW